MSQHYPIETALDVLEAGGLILYPTDTIWAIGCDATNEEALERIYELKQRPHKLPFIHLAASLKMLKQYIPDLHPRIETLLHFHLRPLTMVYENVQGLPAANRAADGTVAFRIPQDGFCQSLIESFGRPIIATAAHLQFERLPRSFGEISSEILTGVDHVVRYRQKDKHIGEPSVIARMSEREELEFIRE